MIAKKTKKGKSPHMAIAEKNIRVNVTFSREENDLIKRVSKEDGRSVSNYIRMATLRAAKLSAVK